MCRRCFCRECVTEHDERLLCAACLQQTAHTGARRRGRLEGARALLAAAFGFLVVWLLFCAAGQILLHIPDTVHEGAAWQQR